MSFSAKPDDPQATRKRSLPDAPQSRRPGTSERAPRRPSVGDHRSRNLEPAPEITGARIVYLSWADTFGRPARARLPGMTACVLPFRPRQPVIAGS